MKAEREVELIGAGDAIHQADGIVDIGQAEGKTSFPQVGIAQPPEEPLPRHPTHLVIESGPAFPLALKAEEYKIANYRVDCLHTVFLKKLPF
jgi:hypothetical protein